MKLGTDIMSQVGTPNFFSFPYHQ